MPSFILDARLRRWKEKEMANSQVMGFLHDVAWEERGSKAG